MSLFSAEYYKANRLKLAESIDHGALIVIAGNGQMQRSGDTNYPFRQDSNMLYLTGLCEPDLLLVMDLKNRKEYIGVPKKSKTELTFGGAHDNANLAQISGIQDIRPASELIEFCRAKKVYMNLPSKNRIGELFVNPTRRFVADALKRRGVTLKDIRPNLASLRSIKQPQEIQAIETAIKLTHEAIMLAQKHLDCRNELGLSAHINAHFARHSVDHAYQPIVASGQNATILHYVKNNATYQEGDTILFDIGAEFEGYAADISRTYIYGQNSRAQSVIDVVQDVQRQIIESIKPEATWKDLSIQTNESMSQALKALGLSHSNLRRYFPHAFGHFLGLDVHDVGDYSRPLAEGMVLTVEPGIYIAEEQLGVRIEDDIVVTSTGARVLGKKP